MFVIDTRDELHKVLDEAREEGLAIIVRLATPSAGAAYDLSAKFGAKPAEAVELLQEIKAEGYRAGIGFHVGSQCANPRAFRTALKIVGEVLDAAKVDLAYHGVHEEPGTAHDQAIFLNTALDFPVEVDGHVSLCIGLV